VLLLTALFAAHAVVVAQTDDGVIRLRPSQSSTAPDIPANTPEADPDPNEDVTGPRRGFDYNAFEARLESLWFQRKTLLADGRHTDAVEQSRLIRSFCLEEGVGRVDNLAAALIAEAGRFVEQGHYSRALESLELAESFDPGRPQIHVARANVYWKSGQGFLATAGQFAASGRAAVFRSIHDLTLFNQLALVLVTAVVGCVLVFSLLMVVRYQVPFRHEIEEWVTQVFSDRWARAAGWALLFLPLVVWFGAGWIALYWILITFRFMRRGEKLVAVAVLLATALVIPAYRLAVTAYGMTADPIVRTTLASAGGEYDPDRILKLRQLVQAHPEDPVYRFLLAGLYKNGRYFEDAFAEYREVLESDPAMEQAHVNIGNIFFATGQHSEAIASYNNAIAINPRSILAYFNRHLAQSESFRFKDAEKSLQEARLIDSKALAEMFASSGAGDERQAVIDATLGMDSVWEAALAGGQANNPPAARLAEPDLASLSRQLINPVSIASLLLLLGCAFSLVLARGAEPARRCIRCGRPFCHYCKSNSREGHEYCSQCLHLFVLGDGLAPETKTRKLYEVERHERISRGGRRLVSLVLPGAAQLLRGRAGRGCFLVLVWLAALLAWQPIGLLPLERFVGLDLPLSVLSSGSVPKAYDLQPLGMLAVMLMVLTWFAGNAWRWRRREL
jgi:tetratricopeptide (TPR) repeat protein